MLRDISDCYAEHIAHAGSLSDFVPVGVLLTTVGDQCTESFWCSGHGFALRAAQAASFPRPCLTVSGQLLNACGSSQLLLLSLPFRRHMLRWSLHEILRLRALRPGEGSRSSIGIDNALALRLRMMVERIWSNKFENQLVQFLLFSCSFGTVFLLRRMKGLRRWNVSVRVNRVVVGCYAKIISAGAVLRRVTLGIAAKYANDRGHLPSKQAGCQLCKSRSMRQ
jgi:hypothetical protein